jgi:hypothetical protein
MTFHYKAIVNVYFICINGFVADKTYIVNICALWSEWLCRLLVEHGVKQAPADSELGHIYHSVCLTRLIIHLRQPLRNRPLQLDIIHTLTHACDLET